MHQSDKAEIEELCFENKALGAKYIDPQSVVIGYWTRYKCQYGCGAYGKSLCCPPHTPTPDETKKILTDYNVGLLVHFGGNVHKGGH